MGLLAVILVCLLVWAGESRSAAPLSATLRTGAAFWLLGHGTRLHLPGGTAALIPLGLSILFAALTARAGASVARVRPAGPRRRNLLACALAVAVPYALVAALVAGIASGGGLHASVLTALLGSLLLATFSAGVGAARELPMASPKRSRTRALAAGVGAAAALLLSLSALVAGIALLTHLSDAAALAKPARAGAVGGLGVIALQAALAPNVVAWTSAYLLGPGFAIGAGSVVSPGVVRLGDVPGLPMLAGLPSGAAAWPFYALYLIPVAAGAAGGVVMIRRLPRSPKIPAAGLLGVAVGLSVGAFMALLAALSGGPVTAGRLATVGPAAGATGLAAALEIGIPCAVAAIVMAWRSRSRRRATHDAAAVDPVAGVDSAGTFTLLRAKQQLASWRAGLNALVRRPLTAIRGWGAGLAAGLGLDRLIAKRRRRQKVTPEAASIRVNLTKARPATPVVELVKHPTPAEDQAAAAEVPRPDVVDLTVADPTAVDPTAVDLGQTIDLSDLTELADEDEPRRRFALRTRRRRKSKVIKLPE